MDAVAVEPVKNMYCTSVSKDKDPTDYAVLVYNQYQSKSEKVYVTDLNGIVQPVNFPIKRISKEDFKMLIKSISSSTCEGVVDDDYIRKRLTANQIYMFLIDTTIKQNSDNKRKNILENVNEYLGKPVSFILAYEKW